MRKKTEARSQSPSFLVRCVNQHALALFDQELAGLARIAPLDLAILYQLRSLPGLEQATLAARVASGAGAFVAALRRLESSRCIVRTPGSRRAVVLSITEQGEDLLGQVAAADLRADQRLLASLTERQRSDLLALLSRLVEKIPEQDRPGTLAL